MKAQDIIAQMPAQVRTQAEAKAAKEGLTLEAFVEKQVSLQLNDEQLDAVSGGAVDAIDWAVVGRIDHNPIRNDTNVGGGVVFRF